MMTWTRDQREMKQLATSDTILPEVIITAQPFFNHLYKLICRHSSLRRYAATVGYNCDSDSTVR